MQKWEYLRKDINADDIDSVLAQLGGEGWELAAISYDRDHEMYFAFFKRPQEAEKRTVPFAMS